MPETLETPAAMCATVRDIHRAEGDKASAAHLLDGEAPIAHPPLQHVSQHPRPPQLPAADDP
jgi:hypothetical protein